MRCSPAPEDLRPRRPQLRLVFLGPDVGLPIAWRDFPAPPAVLSSRSARVSIRRPVQDVPIRQNQRNEKDQVRYRTERKFTKLLQQFIMDWPAVAVGND